MRSRYFLLLGVVFLLCTATTCEPELDESVNIYLKLKNETTENIYVQTDWVKPWEDAYVNFPGWKMYIIRPGAVSVIPVPVYRNHPTANLFHIVVHKQSSMDQYTMMEMYDKQIYDAWHAYSMGELESCQYRLHMTDTLGYCTH